MRGRTRARARPSIIPAAKTPTNNMTFAMVLALSGETVSGLRLCSDGLRGHMPPVQALTGYVECGHADGGRIAVILA